MEPNPDNSKLAAYTRVLIVSSLTSYVRFAVAFISLLLLTPFVLEKIGYSDYGLWTFAFACVGYLEMLECGITNAAIKYFGHSAARGDAEQRNLLASTLRWVYIVLALVVGTLAMAVSFFIPGLFDIGQAQQGKAQILLLILSMRILLNLPLGVYYSMLFGRQKIYVVNIIRTFSLIGYSLSVWWALSVDLGLLTQAALNTAFLFAEHVAFAIACKRLFPAMRISWRLFDRGLLRKVIAFGGFAMATNIGSVVIIRTDPLVVSLFMPLAMVGFYGLALRIAEQVMLVTKQFINLFTPVFAELHGAGDKGAIKVVFINYSKLAFGAAAAVSLPLMIFSTDALILWVGEDFRVVGSVLAILLLTSLIRVMQAAATNSLAMTGFQRFVAGAVGISAVANLVFTVAMGAWMGLLGIAIGGLLVALGTAVVLLLKTCGEFEISTSTYTKKIFVPMLLPLSFQAIACGIFYVSMRPTSLAMLALEMLASLAIFAPAAWWIAFTQAERDFIGRQVAGLRWRRQRDGQAQVSLHLDAKPQPS